jgi:hypothetical protein
MRIYINNLNLEYVPNIQKELVKLLAETVIYIEIYTDEGIYYVDTKSIYRLETNDSDIAIHEKFFKNMTLIVDHSFFEKKQDTNVYGNNIIEKKIKKQIYKLNSNSKLNFVIEMVENLEKKYIPNDVYFESKIPIDIKELFVKQEIIEFLSMLN